VDTLRIPFADAVVVILALIAFGIVIGRAWQAWLYESDCRWTLADDDELADAGPHLRMIRGGRPDPWLFDWESADPALRRGDRG
jgi:hypothetical protein